MEPVDGQGDGSHFSCGRAGCEVDLLPTCPDVLRVINDEGVTVACNSACAAFATDEYCCGGEHGTPETCDSTDWDVDYPAYFKSNCPDAYSYAYDDLASTFTCKATKYNIVIGGP